MINNSADGAGRVPGADVMLVSVMLVLLVPLLDILRATGSSSLTGDLLMYEQLVQKVKD